MIPVVEQLMTTHLLDYSLYRTERPGHAIDLAREAAGKGYEFVVAAGGDGTVNEVMNGLIQAHQQGKGQAALGVLNLGRGNDFSYSAGLPHNLETAVQVLQAGKTRKIDVGHVTGGFFPEGRCFCNGVGIGFDAVVGFESLKLAPLSGFASYLVAALKTISLYFRAPQLRIELDDETIEGPMLMVSIMNGRRMGGGFYMTPEAKQDDGLFDLCLVNQVTRRAMFPLMTRFMKGTQAGHPAIRFRRSRKVVVTALTGALPSHADGETVTVNGTHLEMKILPGALDLVTPPAEAQHA
jgi:YegS/Rv2252/BmrU family lipid kinase